MQAPRWLLTVLLATLSSSAIAASARDAWQEEILLQLSELRKSQGQLRQQVAELRAEVGKSRGTGGGKLPSLDLTNVSVPALGASTASIGIVEFSDFQCPYCRRHQQETLATLIQKYVDSGKARYYFVDYPLTFHSQALPAAVAAACAHAQDAFWKMHDGLFENQARLGTDLYQRLANELKLDRTRFDACLADAKTKRQVSTQMALADAAGVQGTPAFVIGRLNNGVLTDLRSLGGARPFEEFAVVLDRFLDTQASN